MKKAFYAAAVSSIALVATPALAETHFDAFVSVAAGLSDSQVTNSLGPQQAGVAFDVRGSVAVPLKGTSLGFQADVQDTGMFQGSLGRFAGGSYSDNQVNIALHGFTRSDNALFGLIVQYSKNDPSYNDGDPVNKTSGVYVGGEAQYYFPKVTLSGQATYFILPSDGVDGAGNYSDYNANVNGFNLNGKVRYFFNPNTSLTGEVAYEQARSDYDTYVYLHASWFVGGKVEHRLSSMPVSLTGEVSYREGHYRDPNGIWGDGYDHDTRAMLGVKVNFGHTKTLQERDRSGASLDPVRSLAGPDNGYGAYGSDW